MQNTEDSSHPYRFHVYNAEYTSFSHHRGYIEIYILVNRAAILSVFENTAAHSNTDNNSQKEKEENIPYKQNIFSILYFHFTGLSFTWALTDVVV